MESCPHCGKEMEPLVHPTFGLVGYQHDTVACGLRGMRALNEQVFDQMMAAAGNQDTADPGPDGYDREREELVRKFMTATAHYAEDGPTYDPEGEYLCGACLVREKTDSCATVSGKISMTDGSCADWYKGDPAEPLVTIATKYTQREAGYGERPDEKGFGCWPRCGHAKEAKAPDADGRPTWCGLWAVHVQEKACCDRESGDDYIDAPGE